MDYNALTKEVEQALESGNTQKAQDALSKYFDSKVDEEEGEKLVNMTMAMMRAQTSINNKLAAQINKIAEALNATTLAKDDAINEIDIEDARKHIAEG